MPKTMLDLRTAGKQVRKLTLDSLLLATNDPSGSAADAVVSLSDLRFPRGHLWGLTLSNNAIDPTNDIDIAAGECSSSDGICNMVLISSLTKRLDANWVVGNNQGGLDVGAVANGSYHVFLIRRSDTGVVDVLFSASPSAPTMPANYDYKRRIASIIRSAGAIRLFVQDGDQFSWLNPTPDVQVTNPGIAAVTRTLTVPTGIRVNAIVDVGAYVVAGGLGDCPVSIYISDLSVADISPAVGVGSTMHCYGTPPLQMGTMAQVMTNTSGQIRSRIIQSTANTNIYVNTHGWIDTRGRLG